MAMQSQKKQCKKMLPADFSGFMHDFELSIVMELLHVLETQDINWSTTQVESWMYFR